jgi:hypothetical protein
MRRLWQGVCLYSIADSEGTEGPSNHQLIEAGMHHGHCLASWHCCYKATFCMMLVLLKCVCGIMDGIIRSPLILSSWCASPPQGCMCWSLLQRRMVGWQGMLVRSLEDWPLSCYVCRLQCVIPPLQNASVEKVDESSWGPWQTPGCCEY